MSILISIGYNVCRTISPVDSMSDLMKANIEALARSEITSDGWICYWVCYDDTSSDIFVVVPDVMIVQV